MAFMKSVIVECDDCGEVSSFESIPSERTQAEAWRRARQDGWRKFEGLHLCPECREDRRRMPER